MSSRLSLELHVDAHKDWNRWGRFLWYFAGPVLFIFDCLDDDGRPAHAKVLSTIGFFAGLVWTGILMTHLVRLLMIAEHTGGAFPPGWLSVLILGFATLVFGMPYGIDAYKVFCKTRGGGMADALAKVAGPTIDTPGKAYTGDATKDGPNDG